MGAPEKKHILISYVERQNLTMQIHMRHFTRLTDGFSKKLENHIAASLQFMYYRPIRVGLSQFAAWPASRLDCPFHLNSHVVAGSTYASGLKLWFLSA